MACRARESRKVVAAHREGGRRGVVYRKHGRGLIFVILDTRSLDLLFRSKKKANEPIARVMLVVEGIGKAAMLVSDCAMLAQIPY